MKMKSGPARCLLLDIGLVLIDLNYERFANEMAALTGLEPPQLEALITADGLVQKLELGKMTGAEFYEEACRRVGTRFPWHEFLAAWGSVLDQPLIPDQWLAVLACNARLWALSNTNELHFEYMKEHYASLRHFEGFILSHQVGALKPDPRIFLHALEKMQARAVDVLFVDDQEANVRAAQALGIEAFRFLYPDQFAVQLRSRGML